MNAISLFSGIGGIDLASHRCGFKTIAFCESNPFCQEVLTKNFPGIPIYGDISTFEATPYAGRVDLIHGGFPCQDVSTAGRQAGIEGSRSSRWEFGRCKMPRNPHAQSAAEYINKSQCWRCLNSSAMHPDWKENGRWYVSPFPYKAIMSSQLEYRPLSERDKYVDDNGLVEFAKQLGWEEPA